MRYIILQNCVTEIQRINSNLPSILPKHKKSRETVTSRHTMGQRTNETEINWKKFTFSIGVEKSGNQNLYLFCQLME